MTPLMANQHQNFAVAKTSRMAPRLSIQETATYLGAKLRTLAVWANTGLYNLPTIRVEQPCQ